LAVCAFSLVIIIELTDIEISVKDVVMFIMIGSMSATAAALTLLFTIFGHSPIEYLRGIGKQAAMVAARQDFGGFVQMYVFNRFVPGLGLLFVLIPLCIYYGLMCVPHHLSYRKLWISCILLVCGVTCFSIHYLAIRIPSTYYNFSGIIPAILLICGSLTQHCRTQHGSLSSWPVNTFVIVICLTGLSSLVGQIIWLQQNVVEYRTGVENRRTLQDIFSKAAVAGLRVCAELGALSAVSSFKDAMRIRFISVDDELMRRPDASVCELYVAMSNQANEYVPPTIGGYEMKVNRFFEAPSVLPTRPLDMRFAVYGLAGHD